MIRTLVLYSTLSGHYLESRPENQLDSVWFCDDIFPWLGMPPETKNGVIYNLTFADRPIKNGLEIVLEMNGGLPDAFNPRTGERVPFSYKARKYLRTIFPMDQDKMVWARLDKIS